MSLEIKEKLGSSQLEGQKLKVIAEINCNTFFSIMFIKIETILLIWPYFMISVKIGAYLIRDETQERLE